MLQEGQVKECLSEERKELLQEEQVKECLSEERKELLQEEQVKECSNLIHISLRYTVPWSFSRLSRVCSGHSSPLHFSTV